MTNQSPIVMESADAASASNKLRRSAGAGALTALTLRLTKQFVSTGGEGKNVIFSPLSIYTALSLIAAGARGETLDELLAVLGAGSREDLAEFVRVVAERALADDSASGGPHVAFACGVFHDRTRTLKPAFRDAAVESYKAEIRAVDFIEKQKVAVKEINAWVAEATRNLITNVLSPSSLTQDTRLVLANAIYFNGTWEDPFSEDSTRVEKFHRLDGTTVDVPLMRKYGGRQLIAVHDGFKVLMLPYRAPWLGYHRMNTTPQFHMCVSLPDAHDGLHNLMSGSEGFLHDHLPTEKVDVGRLRLPKFKMTFESNLTRVLKDMGLNVTFDPDKADLSDMAEHDSSGLPLVVKDVFHKAVIEVNEEGTEAYAVTFGSVGCTCAARWSPRVIVDFIADHPFLFFIIEQRSKAVVFAGYVLEPKE